MTNSTADLRLPADSAYVAAVRLTTSALAARLGFRVEALEDARVAVSEACSLLLELAGPDESLQIHYGLSTQGLEVSASLGGDPDGSTNEPTAVDEDSFAWQVLATLTTGLTADTTSGRTTISYVSKPATELE